MAKAIVFTDTHNTDNGAHEYRWGCWDDIARWAASPKIDMVMHLGDILDAKDRHPASLVNRLMDKIQAILDTGKPFIILRGNHDYVAVDTPYLHFLRHHPQIVYVDEPRVVDIAGGYRMLAVPHGASWDEHAEWRRKIPLAGGYDLIVAHHTFSGATVDGAGRTLEEGPSPSILDQDCTAGAPVISGHIHQEQVLGNVTYVGSPHPVSFGETTARFVVFDFETRTLKTIRRATTKRLILQYSMRDDGTVLEDPAAETVVAGDHVQIITRVSRAGLLHYQDFRNSIQKKFADIGAVVFKLQANVEELHGQNELSSVVGAAVKSDLDILRDFCTVNAVSSELVEIGESYVRI